MVEIRELENGMHLVCEKNAILHSVTVGFWVRTGQRNEHENEQGMSHFIEHMMFKGTEKRSAQDISAQIDEIGGQINAFTAKEYTCFYARGIDQDIDTILDVLTDMLLNSKLDRESMELEKGVVIEEINMVEDTPEDLVHDLICESFYGENTLARPILGTEESVRAITAPQIRDYMSRHYVPENMVIAVSGNFDIDHIEEKLNELLHAWPYMNKAEQPAGTAVVPPARRLIDKETEQVHICLGYPGISRDSELLYPMAVFNSIFGGGMSCRLFQEIREKRGLAYSVYSYPTQYTDSGYFTIYAGMNVSQAQEVIHIVYDQIREILAGGLKDEEIARGKSQIKGSFILGNESSVNRMSAIGRNYMMRGIIQSEEEVMALIDQVDRESVMKAAQLIFSSAPAVAAIGPQYALEAIMKSLDKETLNA